MKLMVNGKKYTIDKVGDFTVELKGTRGGHAGLTQNIKDPNLWFLTTAHYGSAVVVSFEVLK